jgi:hypothetical protein
MALELLELHATQFDTAKVLQLLPEHTRVEDVLIFLETVLEERASRRREAQVLKSLLYAEHLQVQPPPLLPRVI